MTDSDSGYCSVCRLASETYTEAHIPALTPCWRAVVRKQCVLTQQGPIHRELTLEVHCLPDFPMLTRSLPPNDAERFAHVPAARTGRGFGTHCAKRLKDDKVHTDAKFVLGMPPGPASDSAAAPAALMQNEPGQTRSCVCPGCGRVSEALSPTAHLDTDSPSTCSNSLAVRPRARWSGPRKS